MFPRQMCLCGDWALDSLGSDWRGEVRVAKDDVVRWRSAGIMFMFLISVIAAAALQLMFFRAGLVVGNRRVVVVCSINFSRTHNPPKPFVVCSFLSFAHTYKHPGAYLWCGVACVSCDDVCKWQPQELWGNRVRQTEATDTQREHRAHEEETKKGLQHTLTWNKQFKLVQKGPAQLSCVRVGTFQWKIH